MFPYQRAIVFAIRLVQELARPVHLIRRLGCRVEHERQPAHGIVGKHLRLVRRRMFGIDIAESLLARIG